MFNLGDVSFILPPKTGTRSIAKALQTLGAKKVGGRHSVDKSKLGSVRVAAIRHPCDVIVSWWLYINVDRAKKPDPTMGFNEWWAKKGPSEYHLATTLPGAEYAQYFIRFEYGIHDSLNEILKTHGLPTVREVQHIGAAKTRGHWKAYYDDKTLKEICTRYKDDFKRYAYLDPTEVTDWKAEDYG